MLDFLLNPKVYGTVIILLSSYIIYKILYDIVDKIVIKGKDELEIKKRTKSNDTITRTIRISGDTFDKIVELAEKNSLSFNSVVNQIIEYGLENIQE